MYEDLRGKKLLVMGGVHQICELVLRAQAMGVYVIVVDYLENSPAKKIADKSVLLDALDVDKIVEFCIEEGVDGVTTGYVDILLSPCYAVCSKLGLPYYATEELIYASTDKGYFKVMCDKYNVPVAKTFDIDIEDDKCLAELTYPIFVKPLDASGSRGAKSCHNEEELVQAYKVALEKSDRKKVICEENLIGREFLMDFLFIDGKAYLLSMHDVFKSEERPVEMNSADILINPSKHLCSYMDTIHDNVANMFKAMNCENGIAFLQGYIHNDKMTFFEMGGRLGATYPPIIEKFDGFNPLDSLVHHALTGKMFANIDSIKLNADFDGKGAILNVALNKLVGTVGEIHGLEEIRNIPEVLHIAQYLHEGQKYDASRAVDVVVFMMYLAAKDMKSLFEIIQTIYSKMEVLDEEGNSLLFKKVSMEELQESYK